MLQDLRHAWRTLRHSRGYTAWVVGSLAIGMAVTIAALALLNALMILPFPEVTRPRLDTAYIQPYGCINADRPT